MTLYLITTTLLQCYSIKMICGQMPPQMPKYFPMGNMPPMRSNGPMITSMPSMPNMPMPYPPTFQTLPSSTMNSYQSFNFPIVPTLQNLPNLPNLPNFSNLPSFYNVPNFSSLPPPMSMAPPMPSIQSLAPFPTSNMPNIPMPLPKNLLDPTVLNNLAVSLHLLILSNLMNSAESEPRILARYPAEPNNPQTPPPIPLTYTPQNIQPPPPNGYPQPQSTPTQVQGYFTSDVPEQPNFNQQNPSFTPPNSKFLGNSGFAEPPPVSSMMGVPSFGPGNHQNPNPRAGCSLMSPYEALGPGSSQGFSNDVFSQYGPQNLKADFQSPYQSFANDKTSKDLFSIF